MSKEKARQAEIDEQEVLNLTGPRVKEQQAIQQKLKERQLELKEVNSDTD